MEQRDHICIFGVVSGDLHVNGHELESTRRGFCQRDCPVHRHAIAWPEQSERLKTILDDYAKYHEDLEAQIEDVRATGRTKIVQILTPEQRKRFEKLSEQLPAR
jgi:hypothetical protein